MYQHTTFAPLLHSEGKRAVAYGLSFV